MFSVASSVVCLHDPSKITPSPMFKLDNSKTLGLNSIFNFTGASGDFSLTQSSHISIFYRSAPLWWVVGWNLWLYCQGLLVWYLHWNYWRICHLNHQGELLGLLDQLLSLQLQLLGWFIMAVLVSFKQIFLADKAAPSNKIKNGKKYNKEVCFRSILGLTSNEACKCLVND